jgi:hypothetical protein
MQGLVLDRKMRHASLLCHQASLQAVRQLQRRSPREGSQLLRNVRCFVENVESGASTNSPGRVRDF